MNTHLCISISDESQVGFARRTAVSLAQEQGFSETEFGQLAIVVSEAARNQVKYAGGGSILLRRLPSGPTEGAGVEMLALDTGPGIADLPRSLDDGFSTGGTSGNGLGAIRRLATEFDIFSQPGHGTAILARCRTTLDLDAVEPETTDEALLVGAVNIPMHGETVCGDAWVSHSRPGMDIFMVCDGLGHGPLAHVAARAAVEAFERVFSVEGAYRGPGQILETAHRAMLSTRGAAVAVAEVNRATQTVRFAGIGNIGASLYSLQGEKKMASLSGIVGGEMRKVTEFNFPWTPNTLLIMHSDGLQTQWSLNRLPGIVTRHPALIAGLLYRDFNRGRDDATVLVAGQP